MWIKFTLILNEDKHIGSVEFLFLSTYCGDMLHTVT